VSVRVSIDSVAGFALCVVNDIYLLRQNACTIYSHAHISPRDINLSTRARARARKVAGATRTALSFRRKSASRCGLRNTSACIVAFSPDDGRGLISLHRSPCFRARARARALHMYAIINVMSLLSHSRWHVPYQCSSRTRGSMINDLARPRAVVFKETAASSRAHTHASLHAHIHARMRTAVIDFHR